MRICTICDSLYLDGTDECSKCRDGGNLIPVMQEEDMKEKKLRTLADVKLKNKPGPGWDEIKEHELEKALGYSRLALAMQE